jgi:hypothetical protein
MLLGTAVFFFAEREVNRGGGESRKNSADEQGGSTAAIAIGAPLDGIRHHRRFPAGLRPDPPGVGDADGSQREPLSPPPPTGLPFDGRPAPSGQKAASSRSPTPTVIAASAALKMYQKEKCT